MTLTVKNVSKSFGDQQVLHQISLEVQAGEFVSLIGPSGSGKSTLFSLIGGLLTPDHGEIFMNGQIITNQNGHISYMPQQSSLFPWRTVLDNVLLGQEIYGLKETDRALEMLKTAGLEDVAEDFPHQLSGGMQQRVAFIRALLCPQPFICLDEPFSALDEFTRLDMQKWLLQTWEQLDRSVLFITHNIDEALFLSDKIIILSANPAEIKQIVEVPFARPRHEDILLSPSFLEWKRNIMQIIKS